MRDFSLSLPNSTDLDTNRNQPDSLSMNLRGEQSDGNEPLFDSQPLSHWLNMLSRERSPAGLEAALSAIRTLATSENADLVGRSMLDVLPNLDGSQRLTVIDRQSSLDDHVLRILETSHSSEDLEQVLLGELIHGSPAWQMRLIGRLNRLEKPQPQIIKWINQNLLSDPSCPEDVLQQCVDYLVFAAGEPSMKPQIHKILASSPALDRQFWLTHTQTSSAFSFLQDVFLPHLTETMIDPKSSDSDLAQAAILLAAAVRADAQIAATPVVNGALKRLGEMKASNFADLVGISDYLRDDALPVTNSRASSRGGFSSRGTFSSRGGGFPARSSIDIEYGSGPPQAILCLQLIRLLAELSDKGLVSAEEAARVRSELSRINSFAEMAAPELILGLEKSRIQVFLYWPELKARGWNVIGSGLGMEPDDLQPLHWTSYFISKAIRSRFDLPLNIAVEVQESEPEQPSSTTAVEPAKSSPQEDWARRQMQKYDQNKDGVLTKGEWERMLIKPTGADINQDGQITVKEYAEFRERRNR